MNRVEEGDKILKLNLNVMTLQSENMKFYKKKQKQIYYNRIFSIFSKKKC